MSELALTLNALTGDKKAEQIAILAAMGGDNLPEPVAQAIKDYTEKYAVYLKAVENHRTALLNVNRVKAEQAALKTEAARNAQPDPTDHARIAQATLEQEYRRESVNETRRVAAEYLKRITRETNKHAIAMLETLAATHQAKLKAAASGQEKAQKILEPLYAELQHSVRAIEAVASMGNQPATKLAAEKARQDVKLAKENPLPAPDDNALLRAIDKDKQNAIAREQIAERKRTKSTQTGRVQVF